MNFLNPGFGLLLQQTLIPCELRSAQTPWRCCDGRSAGFNRFTEYIPPKETGWCGMDLILIGSLVSDQSPPRCWRLHSAVLASGLETMMMNTSSDPVTRPGPTHIFSRDQDPRLMQQLSCDQASSRCKISCQLSEYYPARDLFVWRTCRSPWPQVLPPPPPSHVNTNYNCLSHGFTHTSNQPITSPPRRVR